MNQSANLWSRLQQWGINNPQMNNLALPKAVGIFLHSLFPKVSPPSMETYIRALSHQATLLGFPPFINEPAIYHTLQSAYNQAYSQVPYQPRQAPPMHPTDVQTLPHGPAPLWNRTLLWTSQESAGRLSDLLTPVVVKRCHTGHMITVFNHKTARQGRKAPPLQLFVPHGPLSRELEKRAERGHGQPIKLFPECLNTQHALQVARQYLQHPLQARSTRVGAAQRMAAHLPDPQLQRIMGHRLQKSTARYIAHTPVPTVSQRETLALVQSAHHPSRSSVSRKRLRIHSAGHSPRRKRRRLHSGTRVRIIA